MARGISAQGDVLVNQTSDGVDLNAIWAEIADALALYNTERSAVAKLLSYPTIQVANAVPQSISSDSFEEATEFGVPRAIRPPSESGSIAIPHTKACGTLPGTGRAILYRTHSSAEVLALGTVARRSCAKSRCRPPTLTCNSGLTRKGATHGLQRSAMGVQRAARHSCARTIPRATCTTTSAVSSARKPWGHRNVVRPWSRGAAI